MTDPAPDPLLLGVQAGAPAIRGDLRVGSLGAQITSGKRIDRDLQRFYLRPPFEPEAWITAFDRMRLHYVAFSRAEKVLVLRNCNEITFTLR
jgi:hypothetical protein